MRIPPGIPGLVSLVLLLAVLASPVAAANVGYETYSYANEIQETLSGSAISFDAAALNGDCISRVTLTLPAGTVAWIDLYSEGTYLTSGSATWSSSSWGTSELSYDLGGSTYGPEAILNIMNGDRQVDIYSGRDSESNSTGYLLTDHADGFFAIEGKSTFYAVDIQAYPITRIEVNANQDITVDVFHLPYDDFVSATDASVLQRIMEFLGYLYAIAAAVPVICMEVFYWFKFIFIDNIGLTIALYLAVTMAWSVANSRDIFTFLRKFFGLQRTLMDFMLGLVGSIVGTLRNIIDAIKPF